MTSPTASSDLASARLRPWDAAIVLIPLLVLLARVPADGAVLITALAFLGWSAWQRQWTWLRQPWFVLAALTWLYLLVSLPWAADPAHSLADHLGFIRWPLFAMALSVWLLANPARRRLFEWTLLALWTLIVADCLWQYVTGYDFLLGLEKFNETRLTGPFRKPMPGTVLQRLAPLVLWALYSLSFLHRRGLTTPAVALVWVLGAITVFLTGERIAFVMYGFTGGFLLLALLVQHWQHKGRLALTFLAGLAVAVAVVLSQPQQTARTGGSFVADVQRFADTEYGMIYQSALAVWGDAPWTGVGLRNYREVCPEHLATGAARMCGNHPHNVYLQWAVETGVIGLTLFTATVLALLAAIVLPLWRQRHWVALACAGGVWLGGLWPVMSSMSPIDNWIGAIIWLLLGWALGLARHATAIKANRPPGDADHAQP